jgi:quercetin dioxygenase-like cupin family protein
VISHKLRLTLLLSALGSIALVGQPAVLAHAAEGRIIQPDALVWTPFAGLPPGTKIAVLQGDGDFSKAEPFTVRLWLPAGYEIATHSHPTAEVITIISGKLRMAFGEKADASGAQTLIPGSFLILPAGAYHHLWADAETVMEVHSTGPFGVTLAK